MDTYHPNKDDKTIGLQNRKIMTMVWSWSRFNSSCSCKKCPAVRETENSMKELKMSKWKKRSGGDWSFSRKIEPQSIDARSATTINHLLQEKSARREEKEFHCCVDNMSWKLFADWAITWAISLRYAQHSWAPIYISTRPRDSWRSRLSNEYFFQMCHKYVHIENQNTVQTNFERLQLQLWFSDRSAQKNTATKTFWMRFTVEGYKLKSRVRKFHVENRIEIHHAASVLERFPGLDVLQTKLSISFRSIRYVSLDRSTSLFGEVVSG